MLQVRIQGTPNPNARKFVLNTDVKRLGKVSYKDVHDCSHIPLAKALLEISHVSQVHFFENVITVSQDGGADWGALDNAVQDVVEEHIDTHDVDFEDLQELSLEEKRAGLSEELLQIEGILDATIRPGLQADGGDVEAIHLENHILTIRYMGACGGCPSSMEGTLEAIRHILKTEFDEKLEVVAI